jgi:lipoyl-dependent peroxiredoxin
LNGRAFVFSLPDVPASPARCGSFFCPLAKRPLPMNVPLRHSHIIMKTLFTTEAISKGGRSGSIENPDGLLNVALGNPMTKGEEKKGPNPELLFAGAYSACYHGALLNAAKKLGSPVEHSRVRALVSLNEDPDGGYHLAVELHALLPGMDRTQGQRVMEEAHKTCPYSKALRGDAPVKLIVD